MVNKVILIGNVGNNPETKTVGDTQVSGIRLATSESWKDKNGQKQTRTEWHNVEVWGKLAGVVDKYVKKGDRLYIEGSIKYEQYEKDGVTKYTTKIRANNMTMLGSKEQAQNTANEVQQQPTPVDNNSDLGDDLPF